MKKITLLIILFSISILSCSKEEISEEKFFKTWAVQTWSILDEKSYVWYTDSFENVSLSTKVWWKIVSLDKKVWDRVKTQELLASLDWSEAKVWYSSSRDIISSLKELKNSTSISFDAQINAMEQKIKQAQTWVEMAEIWANWATSWLSDTKNIVSNQLLTVQSQLNEAENGLETAKIQYENTQNILDQKESDIYSNSKNAISNANILLWNAIDFLDNLFWVTESNKSKNDDFEDYLSAKNTSLKSKFEDDLENVIKDFKTLKNLPLTNNDEIKEALNQYNSLFSNDIRSLLKLSFTMMENSVESSSLTSQSIQNYKTQIASFQSQNEQVILTVSGNYILWLKWSIDSINNFEKEKKSSLELLERQISQAEKQVETLKSTYKQYSSVWDWQLTSVTTQTQVAQKQKELAKNSLEEAKAWLSALVEQKNAALKQIDAQISEVEGWKDSNAVMIENWKIHSPIDWIITSKTWEVWQVVWAWMPVLVVSKDDKIKVVVSVWEELLNSIKVWDEVKLEIDWTSEIKTWTIKNILPTRDQITKKIWIEIEVSNEKQDIKIWSFSKVYFNVKEENIWTIISNDAIVSNLMIPWVYVLENWKATFKNISIIKQNDNFSQIEWLNIWEIIITEWKENIYDWEILK